MNHVCIIHYYEWSTLMARFRTTHWSAIRWQCTQHTYVQLYNHASDNTQVSNAADNIDDHKMKTDTV